MFWKLKSVSVPLPWGLGDAPVEGADWTLTSKLKVIPGRIGSVSPVRSKVSLEATIVSEPPCPMEYGIPALLIGWGNPTPPISSTICSVV